MYSNVFHTWLKIGKNERGGRGQAQDMDQMYFNCPGAQSGPNRGVPKKVEQRLTQVYILDVDHIWIRL